MDRRKREGKAEKKETKVRSERSKKRCWSEGKMVKGSRLRRRIGGK